MADPDELEALAAIFTSDEFTVLDANKIEFLVYPWPDKLENKDFNHVGIRMQMSFPSGYPDVAPTYEIVWQKGLDKEREQKVKEVFNSTVSGLIGQPMAFDIQSAIQEWLRLNDSPCCTMHDLMMARLNAPASLALVGDESDDDKNSETTSPERGKLADKDLPPESDRLTDQEFERWRHQFKAEMLAAGIWRVETNTTGKLSGREIFEKTVKKNADGNIDDTIWVEATDVANQHLYAEDVEGWSDDE